MKLSLCALNHSIRKENENKTEKSDSPVKPKRTRIRKTVEKDHKRSKKIKKYRKRSKKIKKD